MMREFEDSFGDIFGNNYGPLPYYEPENNEVVGNIPDNVPDNIVKPNTFALSYKTPDITYMDSWVPKQQPKMESYTSQPNTDIIYPMLITFIIVVLIVFAYTNFIYAKKLKKIIKLLLAASADKNINVI